MDKLEIKLLAFAGFRWVDGDWAWVSDNEQIHFMPAPNFPHSLDACFKWLVPKILTLGLNIAHTFPQSGAVKWVVNIIDAEIAGEAETLALALCQAIGELIDKES